MATAHIAQGTTLFRKKRLSPPGGFSVCVSCQHQLPRGWGCSSLPVDRFQGGQDAVFPDAVIFFCLLVVQSDNKCDVRLVLVAARMPAHHKVRTIRSHKTCTLSTQHLLFECNAISFSPSLQSLFSDSTAAASCKPLVSVFRLLITFARPLLLAHSFVLQVPFDQSVRFEPGDHSQWLDNKLSGMTPGSHLDLSADAG